MYFLFKPTSAKFGSGFKRESKNQDFLTFEVEHEVGRRLMDAKGADLTKSHWTLQLYDADAYNPHVDEQGGTGVVQFRERWASFHVVAVLGSRSFRRLFDVLAAGRLPFAVSVEVKREFDGKEALNFGVLPDGDEVIWNLDASNTLIVTGVDFTAPVGTPGVDENGNAEVSALPVSAGDLEKFGVALKREIRGSITKPLTWIAIGMAVLVIRALFFRS